MQDRYVGDIGDYAKYSLLRALSHDRKLGISWYLFPDEDSGHGGHVGYLLQPDKWRDPDPETFDALRQMMGNFFLEKQERSVEVIEQSDLLPDTRFWSKLTVGGPGGPGQAQWRRNWFRKSIDCLKDCDIVFADPDNGLRQREKFEPGQRKSGKSICEDEALRLAANSRPVVVYHHNTMFKGGHHAEVEYWQRRLGNGTCAVRWRLVSPRTFFILNCTKGLRCRAEQWCQKWDLPKQVYLVASP
ncbi:MAG: hypothetical protein OXI76_09510 [Gemmatimonadota bacterium]|nr:hypothetical protein [Gemmatimonadota bacterium]